MNDLVAAIVILGGTATAMAVICGAAAIVKERRQQKESSKKKITLKDRIRKPAFKKLVEKHAELLELQDNTLSLPDRHGKNK